MATVTLVAARGARWSRLGAAVRTLARKPGRAVGLGIMAFFTGLALIGPLFYPGHLAIDPLNVYAGPSAKHWLGTDFAGSDVLQEIVLGARPVLAIAAFAALVAVVLGGAVGLFAGYRRGRADSGLRQVIDFVIAVPNLPLLIVLSTIWKLSNPLVMGFVLGLLGSGIVARSIRSQILSLRERGFMEAVRGLGLPTHHIIIKELLPNIAPYVAMQLMLQLVVFLSSEIALAFLGFMPFSSTNWGTMLYQAVFQGGALNSGTALVYMLAPLTCVLLLILGVVLFLDAIDELFNPRLREQA